MLKYSSAITLILLLSLLYVTCIRTHKYKFTSKISNNLYVEVYQVNRFGVNADYLTDSISFKKYIGDWDEEHETYSYYCEADSVYIMKTVRGNRWARWDTTGGRTTVISNLDTLENLRFCISTLKKQNFFK